MDDIKQFKIKGLVDDHEANFAFSAWMNEKVCAYCGCEHRLYTQGGQECSYCHHHKLVERYKYYKIKDI